MVLHCTVWYGMVWYCVVLYSIVVYGPQMWPQNVTPSNWCQTHIKTGPSKWWMGAKIEDSANPGHGTGFL